MLAAALSAVHARAIVHGDLKPSNVMCEAGSGRIVLMDFGAGARLDDSGRVVLATGSRHYMAPEQLLGLPLGTAADLYALGVTAQFAATGSVPDSAGGMRLDARRDLSARLRRLIQELQKVHPDERPNAEAVLAQCHDLAGEPERLRRRRVRTLVTSVLVLAVIASVVALLFTLQARALAETERNRAVAARDFLLSMMRGPNPYQTAQPTRDLAVLFAHAVEKLPDAFNDDPQTEAQLLQQFGRSLIILDLDEEAVRALQRADQLLAGLGAALTAPARIETRSFLSDVHRRRREFALAIALTAEQASLCGDPPAVAARTCVAIVNDQIEAHGFGGDYTRALELVAQNHLRAESAQLQRDYEAVFIEYLQGMFERELGLGVAALESFVRLTTRTLSVVPPTHPGLLTDLMWLAASADDLGEVALARELNEYVLSGRNALYGKTSRYTVEARLQSARLALHAGDLPAARAAANSLLDDLPHSPAYGGLLDQATLLAAFAGDRNVDNARLDSIENEWQAILGDGATKLAELRLQLAALALRGGQRVRAQALLARTRAVIAGANGQGLRPLYQVIELHLLSGDPAAAAVSIAARRSAIDALLAQQQRRLHDPLTLNFVGVLVPGTAGHAERIRTLAQRVRMRRAEPVK